MYGVTGWVATSAGVNKERSYEKVLDHSVRTYTST